MYVFIHCRYRTYSYIGINNKRISKKESLLSNQSSNTCSTCYYTEIGAFKKEPEFEAIRCLWNKICIFREYILKKILKNSRSRSNRVSLRSLAYSTCKYHTALQLTGYEAEVKLSFYVLVQRLVLFFLYLIIRSIYFWTP